MNEIVKAVQARLWDMQDLPYREFQSKLIPTVPLETIIGRPDASTAKICEGFCQDTGSCRIFASVAPPVLRGK